jgi:DNA-directed RNA polymerase subunit beta
VEGVITSAAVLASSNGRGRLPEGLSGFFLNTYYERERSGMSEFDRNVYRDRENFSKIKSTYRIPDLLDVQKASYERFLQEQSKSPDPKVERKAARRRESEVERENIGLQAVLRSVFPINDFRDICELDFVDYEVGEPKYTIDECRERGMTFAVPLKVKIRLTVWDVDPENKKSKTIRDIKEEDVYFGEIPKMTDNGLFIINGTERVIVSQLHRSPGVFFESNAQRSYFLGKIIPYRGSWVEFEYDSKKDLLYVRIDRKRKLLATTFLRALGYNTDQEILERFYRASKIRIDGKRIYWVVDQNIIGTRLSRDIEGATKADGPIVLAGRKVSKAAFNNMRKAKVTKVEIGAEDLQGALSTSELVDPDSGEVLCESNAPVDGSTVNRLIEAGVTEISVLFPERDVVGATLSKTLAKDTVKTIDDARIEIYRKQRPGDPPTLDTANALFDGMFFEPRKYDLSEVGRHKFNIKLEPKEESEERTLSREDFAEVISYLLKLQNNEGAIDDIDHLGNRRVRAVGELLENQFRIGLVRMERAIKEKMSVHQEIQTAMPKDLINTKPVMASIREFFGSSQLSQFMDQTNPLSEITHKRRLSALGPGGLSRERAGFEVRDVHPSHYGRICPIETPEGPNIGLISSLSCYARIDKFGFIESPFREVRDGRVVDQYEITNQGDTKLVVGKVYERDEVEKENARVAKKKGMPAETEAHAIYLNAGKGDKHFIAQANVELDENQRIIRDLVTARHGGDTLLVEKERIEYVDVSPKQLVSVAASLIPFLENDDANRALMGSNMQRQAVPLIKAEAPLVGTGMEYKAAMDSGAVILCKQDGVVETVDGERIIVRAVSTNGDELRGSGVDIYKLTKFARSNQNTSITQKPLVREGDRVRKNQVLADGPCTELGELALGRNVLVAFMPWRGYNFEDAILISEQLVKDDSYTSIHIEELEVEARDTKLGPEEITRDIPNVSESILSDLDESGIIRIGAKVKQGNIIVGKVTPKGETQLTPEEKLLRAIFGEKAGEVKDASLYASPGVEGTVVNVKVFTRRGVEKDSRTLEIEESEIKRLEKDLQDEIRILCEGARERFISFLEKQKLKKKLADVSGKTIGKKGEALKRSTLDQLSYQELAEVEVADEDVNARVHEIVAKIEKEIDELHFRHDERVERIEKGDELAPGVIKMVKVYIAMKRKIAVGDKMAGRHGNKGVISRILPEEDMPYLPDGTPVEIVLNPLGVPSRMNVGQVLETHLGWAARALGVHFATPVFDGATESEVKDQLEKAGLPLSGKEELIDGMTGEPFDQKITVGYIYMNKLSHMVDDKIHARSIGPYSLITQQPLGGKAQFGGQRFGEMEVWALEAYGAANILQELLTAKSDDVQGRAKIYEAIVKGESTYSPGIPESFNVLIRELQSLALDVELMEKPKKKLRRNVEAFEQAEAALGGIDLDTDAVAVDIETAEETE